MVRLPAFWHDGKEIMKGKIRKKLLTRELAAVYVSFVLFVILLVIPTGYEEAVIYQGTDRCAAEVLETDESMIIDTGLVKSGEQSCRVRLLGGRFKGQETDAFNMLNGSLENDKLFVAGDKAQVVISYQGDEIISVNMIDHYRIPWEIALAAMFILALILVAGKNRNPCDPLLFHYGADDLEGTRSDVSERIPSGRYGYYYYRSADSRDHFTRLWL